ncbi:Uncharacterised protein [Mycobacterium tuberculosis]|nr:Uncharacterised protein [Mycobacterium tuberculosis]CNV36437.1 Uncharacterised protein [Mycobacterium tuberculosis]CNX79100.1 Uncharacterised protein [Mycobacterium tuberculosis]
MTGERADRHRLGELEASDGAVAAPPATGAPAALTYGELAQQHRVAPLQHLGIGEPGVGHVRLHHRGPVVPVTGPGARSYGFVVLVPLVAERDVVHRPGSLGLHTQRGEQRAGDRLRGFDVASDHRGGMGWCEHRAFGDDDTQRAQATVVERDVVGDQGPEHVEHRRIHHRGRCVEVGVQLSRGSGEVDGRAAGGAVDGDAHGDRRARIHAVAVGAVVEPVDDPADRFLGVVLDVAHVGRHHVAAEVVDHFSDLVDALLVGGDLRAQIGEVGVGIAGTERRLGKQAPGFGLAEPSVLGEQPVVEQHALFVDLAAVGGHGAGGDAADFGVVPARGDKE